MLFFINKSILLSIGFTTQLFLSFFIWQEKNDLITIVLFNMIFYLAIPFASNLSAYLSDKIDPKLSLLLSIFLQVLQMTYVIYNFQNLFFTEITVTAIMGGLAEGFRSVPFNNVYNALSKGKERENIYSENYITAQLTELFIPLTFAFIIAYTGSYILIFRTVIVLLALSSILLLLQKIAIEKNSFNLKQIFQFPGSNREKITLVTSEFLEGLAEGVTLSLLPIIVLSFSGSILNWGIIKTVFIVIAILISILFDLYITSKSSKFIYSIGALIFAASNIFLFTQINIYIILVFLFSKTLMDVIREVSYTTSVRKISELDSEINSLQSEYEFLQDLFTNLGRVATLVLVYIMSFFISQDVWMRIILLFVGVTPLVTLSVLGRSVIFKENIYKVNFLKNIKIFKEKTHFNTSSFLTHEPENIVNTDKNDVEKEDKSDELPTLTG